VRLPIRVRLTAWYAVLLGAILTALGTFVVLQLDADLQDRVDRDVTVAAEKIGTDYAAGGKTELRGTAAAALPRTGAATQVLDRAGRVLVAFGAASPMRPLVPADVRADALLGEPRVVGIHVGARENRFRAWVGPVRRLGRRHVMVVAESLREAQAPVRRVLMLLLLAGPAALAATALVGWWLARKALLPVERMASAASAIEIDHMKERVAVPRAADELRHLAVTLNAMLDRLERGVTEKRRLVADASHELRTPLAVMRTELDVSLRADDLSGPAREVLESTRDEVDRMSRTVDNLLTLGQVDEGRLRLLTTTVDLWDAIEGAVRPLLALAAHKGVRVVLDGRGAHDRTVASADRQRLHQALTNLIDNAIKYTPSGGEVRVCAWRNEAEIGVTVTDDGPGIPAEARAHVFDRFFRVERAPGRDAGGSGLGLAICREIARAHGGRVFIESEEGTGSAFSFALPRGRVAETAAPVSAPA
jgi:heavy metal sensor kinase